MKEIAILSDIHSNYHAFSACIDYSIARNIKEFLFLGDYVSDCAYPQDTMKLLYHLNKHYTCTFLRGNREEYLIRHKNSTTDNWKIPSSATGSLLYTYENLTEKDLAFFASLPICGSKIIEDYPPFFYCHGSLEKSNGDLSFGSDYANKTLQNLPADYLFCGHSHEQGIYTYKKKHLINVGSVGVPWHHHGNAQFCIIHGTHPSWEIELIQIPYDKEQTIYDLSNSGLSKKANIWVQLVEETLRTGIDHTDACLETALSLCQQQEGITSWSALPEKYWQMAFQQLIKH